MVTEFKTNYVIAVADQLSFVSAFLGGVSATILIAVLVTGSAKRSISLVAASSAIAACGHLIAVIAAWRLSVGLHPDLPFTPDPVVLDKLWSGMIRGYGVGVLGLIVSVGFAGWIHSKKLGVITTSAACLAIAFFATTSIYTR